MVLALLKNLWRGWKRLVHGLNAAISFTLMAVVYCTAVMPVAVGFRIFRPDALDRGLGDPTSDSEWRRLIEQRQDLRRAQRPF